MRRVWVSEKSIRHGRFPAGEQPDEVIFSNFEMSAIACPQAEEGVEGIRYFTTPYLDLLTPPLFEKWVGDSSHSSTLIVWGST